MDDHELGIFFSLKEISGRKYQAEAWEVFMRHSDPEMLKDSELFHGDVSGLLPGAARMFCIAVRAENLIVIQYLKNIFASCDDPRLAPPYDRVRESEIIQKHGLKHRGKVDSKGRLETREWGRVDQHLCKVTGWPYAPHTYPKHLSEKMVRELEEMREPGRRTPVASDSLPGFTPAPSSKAPARRGADILRIAAYSLIVAIIGGLLVLGWLTRDKVSGYMGKRGSELSLQLELGSEAYEKVTAGFALAGIERPPHDLDLAELNEKLSGRAYHVLNHENESLFDVTVDCMVWFAASEKRDPLPETTIQAFIKINMKSLDGSPLWVCQSKGTRSSPGTEKENPDLRRQALSAAIKNIDMTCLADGRSVKSFQDNNDYSGLNRHVQYTLSEGKRALANAESALATESQRAELETKLRERLGGQWIMTNHIFLKSGKKLAAVILEEKGPTLHLRLKGGRTTIAKDRIEKIEPFDREQFAQDIGRVLGPPKKGFEHEWEHIVCDGLIEELTERCTVYGPPFPGARVLSIGSNEKTGALKAVVKTPRGRKTVKNGDRLLGFNVIGIDAETSSVLVRMGPKGEILRIWPKT